MEATLSFPATPSFPAPRRVLLALLAFLTALPLMATSFATGAADAAPGQTRAQVRTDDRSVLVSVANASLATEDGHLVFRDTAGAVVERFPLTFIAPDKRTYPIDASVKGNSARLTPSKDRARSAATDVALLKRTEVADENGYKSRDERNDAALTRLGKEVAMGVTVTTVIGAAIGAVLGGIVGCVAGLAAGPLGCFFAGIPLGTAAGTGIGVILAGGVAGAAVIRYFDTVTKPFKHVETPKTEKAKSDSKTESKTKS